MLELHENRKAQCWSYTRIGRSNAGVTREQEGLMMELHENRKVQCWSYTRTGRSNDGVT